MNILFLVTLSIYFAYGEEEVCSLDKLPKLQLALLVDMTLDYRETTWGYPQQHIYYLFAKKIFENVPDAEIALVGYKHWSGEVSNLTTDHCYELLLPFTVDISTIGETLDSYTALKGKRGIAGHTVPISMTMLNAIHDKELKWNQAFSDNEQAVRKAFVYVTLKNITTTIKDPKNRTPSQGLPSETCGNSLPPSPAVLGNALTKHGVSIFLASYEAEEYTNKNFAVFKAHLDLFANSAFRVPVYATYVHHNNETINEAYFKDDDKQYLRVAKEIYSLVTQEASGCTFASPKAYNTLGV